MCFTIFPYEQAKFLIQQAVEDIKTNLQDCFCHAKGEELAELASFVILNHTTEFAMGQYSTYLLRHGIEYDTDEFLCSILYLFLDLEEPELGEHLPAKTRRFAEKSSMLPGNILDHAGREVD